MMGRLRFLETVAWVAFYAGFLGFALFYSAGTPAYRAVFIERTAAYALPDPSIAYRPGTPIRGNVPAGYFGGGWWWADEHATWGRGKRSVINLRPTVVLGAGSRVSGVLTALIGRLIKQQTVILSANGTEIGRVLVTRGRDTVETFDFALPAPVAAGELLQIVFETPGAEAPVLAFIDGNTRQLGVRLVEMTVLPSS